MAKMGRPPKDLEMMKRFSKNFERIRKSKYITQKMISDALEINQQTVSKWSRSLSMPTGNNLTKVADYLGVSREELLKEPAETESQPSQKTNDPANADMT